MKYLCACDGCQLQQSHPDGPSIEVGLSTAGREMFAAARSVFPRVDPDDDAIWVPEENRLPPTVDAGWLICCDRDGCDWHVHVAQVDCPTIPQAIAIVVVLGGTATTTSSGKLHSHCPKHAERP